MEIYELVESIQGIRMGDRDSTKSLGFYADKAFAEALRDELRGPAGQFGIHKRAISLRTHPVNTKVVHRDTGDRLADVHGR